MTMNHWMVAAGRLETVPISKNDRKYRLCKNPIKYRYFLSKARQLPFNLGTIPLEGNIPKGEFQ